MWWWDLGAALPCVNSPISKRWLDVVVFQQGRGSVTVQLVSKKSAIRFWNDRSAIQAEAIILENAAGSKVCRWSGLEGLNLGGLQVVFRGFQDVMCENEKVCRGHQSSLANRSTRTPETSAYRPVFLRVYSVETVLAADPDYFTFTDAYLPPDYDMCDQTI